ncbi:MAG TPA: UvrD-helicase domain-containing protein [Vicinamibacterales bacterium]
MTRPLADAAAREAIATALDETMVVEAAAGTGKTTELVKRIVRVLEDEKALIGGIVAVTFTEKAAGELKLRLRQALDVARTASPAGTSKRAALDQALSGLENAYISTIHGFCAELLRERPVEAGVDPLFAVLTEPQAERLFDEAFNGWLQRQLQAPPEGIRRALRRSVWQGFGDIRREDTPVDRLRRAAWDLAQWRDFRVSWTRNPFDRDGALSALVASLHEFAEASERPSYVNDTLHLDTAPARHLGQDIALQEAHDENALTSSGDAWEAAFVDLSRNRTFSKARRGRGPGYRPGVPRAQLLAMLDGLRAQLAQFHLDADADLAAALQQELSGAIDRYEALKARGGKLDFLDLLLKARDLVKTNAGVRRGFQERFTHIFVDEFQDTDPLQAELLLLLASQDPDTTDWRKVIPCPGRLFIVGDPKQSIYRFRRADVGIYRDVCEQLQRHGARVEHLTTSFRSVPEIQTCVNAAFAPIMTGDAATLQASYVPLRPHRQSLARQPSVVALPVPEPYGSRNISAKEIERSLPDAAGAFVDWLINESGWRVTEGSGDPPVPVAAKHVCLLFRRFISFGEDVTLPYVRALEARGVHHVLVGGKTFHDREEVEAIRAALAAVEWPDDELSVFATLKGTLFSIGDEELFEWKQRFGVFHPFRIPRPFREESDADPEIGRQTHLRPIVDALVVLQRLHRRRNYRPIGDTIQDLLNATRGHVGLVLRSGGEQSLANVLHVAELARQYEAGGGLSFRGFVDELRVAAETAQAAEAPILEEGSDGVRMMTVHKAKGLEFPVVVLADLTCKLSRSDAGRWLDPERGLCALKIGGWAPIDLLLHDAEEAARDRAEGERLAYVAATRARDLLVVPAIGDGPYDGSWLDPLSSAVYPAESTRRNATRSAGCPPFASKDTVLRRPDGDPASAKTVAPGAHQIANHQITKSPDHQITWWDPRNLRLGVSSPFGLHRDDLIVKDGDMFAVDERRQTYERWRAGRESAIAAAQRPIVRVQTATAAAATIAQDGLDTAIAERADIRIVALPGAAGRPRGARFGTLVHAVLATVPLDAATAVVSRTAETHGRVLGAPPEEVAAAVTVAAAVLDHDLMRRVRVATNVKRETPVSWLQEDGTLIEGVLDLCFDEGDLTTVVDFKTDQELAAGESRYRAQLHQYVSAVTRATRRPAAGVLFRI